MRGKLGTFVVIILRDNPASIKWIIKGLVKNLKKKLKKGKEFKEIYNQKVKIGLERAK